MKVFNHGTVLADLSVTTPEVDGYTLLKLTCSVKLRTDLTLGKHMLAGVKHEHRTVGSC
jgi:hypothetical protein